MISKLPSQRRRRTFFHSNICDLLMLRISMTKMMSAEMVSNVFINEQELLIIR